MKRGTKLAKHLKGGNLPCGCVVALFDVARDNCVYLSI